MGAADSGSVGDGGGAGGAGGVKVHNVGLLGGQANPLDDLVIELSAVLDGVVLPDVISG